MLSCARCGALACLQRSDAHAPLVERRLTSLSSLTLQTAVHNSALLPAGLDALRWHPSLVDLELSRHTWAFLDRMLPHRLTSLRMKNWNFPGGGKGLSLVGMLAGASMSSRLQSGHEPAGACCQPCWHWQMCSS